jgi:chromosome segregation ATPase
VRFSGIAAELERLRADLESFRAPGGRFTAHDGDRHWQRMDDLDKRIREQEMRPPRLNPGLDEVKRDVSELELRVGVLNEQLRHIEQEQDRLCQRLAACKQERR